MTKLWCLTTIAMCAALYAHSGDTLDVPYGTRPVIDGLVSAGEWDDADTVMLSGLPDGSVTIFYKENPDTLYMALSVPDITYYDVDNITLHFDSLHNAGIAPQIDDFGCGTHRGDMWVEFVGNGTGWVIQTPSGWYGAITTNVNNWTAEFAISYSKMGIIPNSSKTLGFCAQIGDVGNGVVRWPSSAQNNVPNTWGDIYSPDNWAQPDTVPPQITVIAPNGGENWLVGWLVQFRLSYGMHLIISR